MASNVRFLDNVKVGAYGGGTGGDSISSSYAATASLAQSGNGPFTGSFTGSFIGNGEGLFSGSFSGSATFALAAKSASHAVFADSASYAISASHEIIKEISSSYADTATTASYAITASHALNSANPFPFTGDAQITGSLNVSGSVDIAMPEGSAFTIHETDYPFGVSNRLDFNFNSGDPILEIASRSTTSSLHLKTDYTGQGLLLTSNGFLKYITGGTTYGVQLTTEFKPEDTTGAIPLGNYNRRWADLYLFNGKKISFGTNASPYPDLVSFRHTAGTNTLVMSGSSDVTLDIRGNITASGNISSSATSTASFGTYLGDGSALTGIVKTTGTPVDNQIPIFTDSSTIEGTSSFTYNSTTRELLLGPSSAGSSESNTLRVQGYDSSTPAILKLGWNNYGGAALESGFNGSLKVYNFGSSATKGGRLILGEDGLDSGSNQINYLWIRGDNEDDSAHIYMGANSATYASEIGIERQEGTGVNYESDISLRAAAGLSQHKSEYIFSRKGMFQAQDAGFTVSGSGQVFINTTASLINPTTKITGFDQALVVNGDITSSGLFSSTAQISGSFSGSFQGDGSQLTGIEAGTNLTQSLFVSPSGNDGTAAVGNMSKPFQTILAATASANIGDTIFVYPGEYTEDANIIKDGVNYYFSPGSSISSTQNIIAGTFEYPLNIRGAAKFENNSTNKGVASFTTNKGGYIEFEESKTTSINAAYINAFSVSNPSQDEERSLRIRGRIIDSGSSFNIGVVFNITGDNANLVDFEGEILSIKGNGVCAQTRYSPGSDNIFLKGNFYSENSYCFDFDGRNNNIKIEGNIAIGDAANNYAVYCGGTGDDLHIIGNIVGAIYVGSGVGVSAATGVIVEGRQSGGSSPGSLGLLQIHGGKNLFKHTINASENIFYINGGYSLFNGQTYCSSEGHKIFNVQSGKLIYNGISVDAGEVRAASNIVAGGELIINNELEHYGSSYPNNRFCFSLTGGTLEINDKIRYHQNSTGSGIIDMSGGYLKLNGAQLIHDAGTGSYAYAIDLNSGTHSGSIFNNSFTNLTPFGPGSFTNEIVGGGTLFYSDKLY